jgi:DNA-binding NarL/FixJ family response regulator
LKALGKTAVARQRLKKTEVRANSGEGDGGSDGRFCGPNGSSEISPSKEGNINGSPQLAISVYLVVQTRLLRETLVRLLQKQVGIAVVGESQCSQSTNEHLAAIPCDMLLLDSLSTVYARNLIEELNERTSQTKVVLFGMDEDEECFLTAVRLGVCGYLLKDASSAEIISAVRGVARGEAVCPPRLCMSLFQHIAQEFRERSGMDHHAACAKIGLTYRQRELIGLVAKGMTNKEIAAQLNLSEYTVKNHIHRIMRRVEADSRQEAVEVVRAGGLLLNA